jgi:hypothetical protein
MRANSEDFSAPGDKLVFLAVSVPKLLIVLENAEIDNAANSQ